MRMKKVAKLQNDILHNIQYFRLKEEIACTEKKIEVIKEKKDFAVLDVIGQGKKKKIENNQNHIETVDKAIKAMETDKRKYDRGIIDKNLAMLRGLPNYDFIACQIAACAVLDITVPYCNTDDYLENLSGKLFGDKARIASIISQRNKVAKALNNSLFPTEDGVQNFIKNGAQMVAVNLIVAGFTKLKFRKATPIVVVASIAIQESIHKGIKIFKRWQGKRILSKLNSDSFDYLLLTNLLLMDVANSLWTEKKLTDLDYQKFFCSKMEALGKCRSLIQQDLYHKWKDRDENIKKISLLQSFDSYVIKHLIPQERA